MQSVEEFTEEAAAWLADNATIKREDNSAKEIVWGEGEFSTSVFHALEHEEEAHLIESITEWVKAKAEVGYHAAASPTSPPPPATCASVPTAIVTDRSR